MPPRPKRPSTLSGSSSIDAAVRSGAGLPTHKRPKFDARNPHKLAPDAPSDDEVPDLFLEVDEGAIGKRKVHRNAVELEGYETDSSEEGFDATHKQWAKEGEKGKVKKDADAMADDDDDMFGGEDVDDDAADNNDTGKTGEDAEYRKAKTVKFMNIDEIEGQDMSSKREFADIIDEDKGRGDESSTDDEDDPEKRAKTDDALDPEVGAGGKKKHAPKIDAFNMQAEMEEGRFDSAGNFIRKATDADAVHDRWLEGVSRKDMKRAKEAMEQREADAREKMKADDAIMTSDVLSTLILCLERGESVLEALARLGGGNKKKQSTANKNKNRWREKRKAAAEAKANDSMEIEKVAESKKGKESEDPEEARRKEAVERITGAADVLLTRGQLEIYDETKESLMRQFKRETGEDWVEPKKQLDDEPASDIPQPDKQWEYRWTDGRDDGAVYGPYGTAEMSSWNAHGFFGEGVEFREKDIGEWSKVPGFM
ncbi:hypothetical protein EX30DRAFT_339412 [Ascodesmis nigricans]|uniref:GYF domain-containing protein n=1 Tax=Ascodesmis nigricans TaxID=341454 RepID=A0A4S2N2Q1_9PEZI|nr:hypothetical protein EX30DRAFT_339412 [Ascodesmis nigricans]